MAEYIERAKAIERIRPHVKPTTVYGEGYMQAIEHAVDILELMPAADVQPVRRGEWEIFWQNGKPKLKCTNCHSLFDIRTNDKHICIYPKFCEECGADMRGERNDT